MCGWCCPVTCKLALYFSHLKKDVNKKYLPEISIYILSLFLLNENFLREIKKGHRLTLSKNIFKDFFPNDLNSPSDIPP